MGAMSVWLPASVRKGQTREHINPGYSCNKSWTNQFWLLWKLISFTSQNSPLSPTDCYSSYSRYAMSPFQFLFPISPSCGGLLAYPCGQPRSSLRLRVRFRARTVRLARSSKSFSAFGVLRCPYLVLPFWSMRLSRLPMLRHPRPPVLAAGVTRLDTAHSPDGVFAASSLCLAPF